MVIDVVYEALIFKSKVVIIDWVNLRLGIRAIHKAIIFIIILSSVFVPLPQNQARSLDIISVYGKGCHSCFLEYVQYLKEALKQIGIENVDTFYRENELELLELRENLDVPPDMQTYTAVAIDDRFLFEGEVPVIIIKDFIKNHKQKYDYLVVFYNELEGSYKIIINKETIKECEIKTSISECIENIDERLPGSIIQLVLVSGFLDGINPCAFSVLIFFIALIFSMGTMSSPENVRKKVIITGIIYIGSVFLAYLLIGLALFKIISIMPFSHIISRAGALIMILFGLINIKDYFWTDYGFTIRIPKFGWDIIRTWMRKLTLPAIFVTGFMVGIFEFPCTGSIYFAITGLLAIKSTFLEGLIYLIFYNLAFIFPLLVVLYIAVNKNIMRFSLEAWQTKGEKPLKLVSGIIFVTLGIIMLLLRIL